MTLAQVWMAGPSLTAPGGMSAVVTAYRDAGLFESAGVRYLNTYESPHLATQLLVFGRAWLALLRGLMAGRVALLHVHSASRGSFWRKSLLCALARWFRVPYLFHIHSGEFEVFATQECGRFAGRWLRLTLGHAHSVLVLTPGWQLALQPLAPTVVCVVVPNPVVLPDLEPAPRCLRRRLIFLGRIRQKKGAFDLLRAMAKVLPKVPDATLVMAGDGEIEAARALCADLGLQHCVSFPGWIDGQAKEAALRASDVFVLPSYFEGLPIGILEAMASGVVVVASPVGGVPDLLTAGVDGRLVAAGDIQGLADALVHVLLSSRDADSMVAAAWKRVQEHDVNRVVAILSQLYASARLPRRQSS